MFHTVLFESYSTRAGMSAFSRLIVIGALPWHIPHDFTTTFTFDEYKTLHVVKRWWLSVRHMLSEYGHLLAKICTTALRMCCLDGVLHVNNRWHLILVWLFVVRWRKNKWQKNYNSNELYPFDILTRLGSPTNSFVHPVFFCQNGCPARGVC